MDEIPSWPTESPKWNNSCMKLLLGGNICTNSVPTTNLNEVMNKSRDFPIKFPVIAITSQNLRSSVDREILERNIQSAYPVIHECVLNLCAKFLLFKQEFGTKIEKALYKNMFLKDFIQRLLYKRAVMFMCECDEYLLLDGSEGIENWTKIGTEHEKKPLVLQNCLSYDEIKLSAFLSVSSYSYFINDGSRYNNGDVEMTRSNLEPEGIVIGLIGTRLEKKGVMEYQELVISKTQNTTRNGYGKSEKSLHKLFSDFYEEMCFTYEDVQNIQSEQNKRFVKLEDGLYFDNVAFSKRLALSFDTLLLEANHRAKEKLTTAYIHLVGIGLGVWRISSHQGQVFADTFAKRLSVLGKQLNHVSDIHFAYFSNSLHCGGYKDGDLFPIQNHPNGGIKIHISKREPFTKLNDTGKLLVVSYAWDGNALPGNEFWSGMLGSTGDSATAASSQIAELHNPHINNTVCADNLMVVTLQGLLLPLHKYIEACTKQNN